MITTTKGEMDEGLLQKREGEIDDENEHTTWVEYWMNGDPLCTHVKYAPDHKGTAWCAGCGAELVHRSAHVTLKKPVSAFGGAASLQ